MKTAVEMNTYTKQMCVHGCMLYSVQDLSHFLGVYIAKTVKIIA